MSEDRREEKAAAALHAVIEQERAIGEAARRFADAHKHHQVTRCTPETVAAMAEAFLALESAKERYAASRVEARKLCGGFVKPIAAPAAKEAAPAVKEKEAAPKK